MGIRLPSLALALAGLMSPAIRGAGGADALDRDFAAPPPPARPYVWWHWLSGNVTREGIDRDLAAMKEMGVGGAVICDLGSTPGTGSGAGEGGIANSPWPGVVYFNEEWWALFRHAVEEGRKLGFDMGMNNCPGWSASGDRWITPELSMQKLVWSETRVRGPSVYSGMLARPETDPKWNFYRDVAVLAVPDGDADASRVVDLGPGPGPDGSLAWEVPAGAWTVYRFGHTTTGVTTHPAPDGYPDSLECDKLSARAAEFHVAHVLGAVRDHIGDPAGAGLRNILFDSYEAGPQDWTGDFRGQFRALRGYDPLPWLPVIAGRKIGGAALAARFEWDMRRTVSDLFARNDFGTFRRLIESAGLRMSLEPYTGFPDPPFDTIASTAECTSPMAEFWSNPASWRTGRADHDIIVQTVAAAAQALGRRVVGAESFTGFPMDSEWTEDPAFLKPAADAALCGGVNQFQLHSWVLQPFGEGVRPGLTLGWWGTHFGRNQTWFGPGKAFFDYMARCAAVLQHGSVVRDFCTLGFAMEGGDALSGRLLLGATVAGGRIAVPGGRSYAVLALPPSDRTMLPEIAAKLRELVASGAVVVGPRPLSSPSLGDYPGCDRKVAAIGAEVWGAADGAGATENHYGKGMAFQGVTVAEVLARRGIGPDFSTEAAGPADIRAIHRREGDTDIYFVANLGRRPVDATLAFRVAGKAPELWFPADGRRVAAASWEMKDGRTRIPLRFGPADSLFVVFRHPAAGTPAPLRNSGAGAAGLPPPAGLAGPWEVRFAPGWGAPESVAMGRLASWTESADPGIRYYSGTATYLRQVAIAPEFIGPGRRVILELGDVRSLARVAVNGRDMGVAWFPPFAVDITRAVHGGANRLEIAVTNTWHNRLIGDEQHAPDMDWGPSRLFRRTIPVGAPLARFPDWLVRGRARPVPQRLTFTDWNYFSKDSPLTDAGLLGPVVLRCEREEAAVPRQPAGPN